MPAQLRTAVSLRCRKRFARLEPRSILASRWFLPLVALALSVQLPVWTSLAEQNEPVDSRKQLYSFLLNECRKHFQHRRQEIEQLQSAEQIRQRQDRLRKQFVAALGGFPDKTPLRPQVTGTLTGVGFRVEKVIFESRPGHHVTAALYVPEGQGPFPGVLLPCGHSANGKAAEAYQRACMSLAKHGFVVLCYDPIGQGERYQILDDEGKPRIRSSTTEHTLTGIAALLVGWNTASFRIWDGMRALDYLSSRPEVDTHRLGCTGNSGGGTLTAYLMALDDRILAAAPSCYITSLERLFETIGPQDAEQNIPGQVAFGLDHADYITLRAPKPTLVLTATYDYFDIRGSWETFREAKRLYGLLGFPERVELAEFPTKHGFHKGQREAMLRWMRRWLQGKDDAATEPDFPVFTDAQLQCTKTGQVLADLKGVSVFDICRQEADRCRQLRADWLKQPAEARRKILANLLAWREVTPAKTVSVRTGGTRRLLETEPGITVSVQLVRSSQDGPLTVCVVESEAQLADLLKEGSATGHRLNGTVWAMVPRGMTALLKAKPGSMEMAGPDWREAFLALHLNRPLLGQRAWDVVSVTEALRQEFPHRSVQLVGLGRCGPIVLHAAVLAPKVDSLILADMLASWETIIRDRISIGQLANVVPGALRHYDLPELMTLLAPRPLEIFHPVSADGSELSEEQIRAIFRPALEAYHRAGAADRFHLRTRGK